MQLNEVNDYLYIACAQAVTDENLQSNGITCVINCSMREPTFKINNIRYLSVMVDDNIKEDISIHFDHVCDLIHEIHEAKGKTLVYCIAGISRSASFCLAYLIIYQNMTLKDAFKYLKSRRHYICPNNGFFEQLIALELRVHGEQTVKMVNIANADEVEIIVPDLLQEVFKGMVWLKSIKGVIRK